MKYLVEITKKNADEHSDAAHTWVKGVFDDGGLQSIVVQAIDRLTIQRGPLLDVKVTAVDG
jgi:hypothetical protein